MGREEKLRKHACPLCPVCPAYEKYFMINVLVGKLPGQVANGACPALSLRLQKT